MSQSQEVYQLDSTNLSEPILIVDDDEIDLDYIKTLLEKSNYSVLTASNGIKALDILKKTKTCMIICDQYMPGMDGLAVLKETRALQPEAVRILLTGLEDPNLLIEAINTGRVSHFLRKPVDNETLIRVIQNTLKPYFISKENRELHEKIIEQHKELINSHQLLRNDIIMGEQIYEQLLMGKAPGDIPDFDIAALTIPSKELDGDFFEFFRPSDNRLDLAVGDVMGKGIPAALIATAMRSQLAHYAFPINYAKTFEKGSWHDDLYSPEAIINETQKDMINPLQNLEYFSSVLYASFDLTRNTLTYVNCGFPPPILFSADKISFLDVHFPPLGMFRDETYGSAKQTFNPGDLFIFYSDGVTDARNLQSEIFGIDRLLKSARENAHLPASNIVDSIKFKIFEFTNSIDLQDDLTIVVIKIEESFSPIAPLFKTAKFSNDLSQLVAVRDYVKLFCSTVPGDADSYCYQMQLAVDEIFTNIVKHGHSNHEQGEILINGTFTPDSVRFNIFDKGTAFDPSEINEPSLTGDRFGGFGWYIVRKIMDKIIYLRKKENNGWNHLEISKKFLPAL